jgi:hypothetical protein
MPLDPAYDPMLQPGAFDDQFAQPWPPPAWQAGPDGGPVPMDLGPQPVDPPTMPSGVPPQEPIQPETVLPPPPPIFNPFASPPPEALPDPFAAPPMPDALTGVAGQDLAHPFAGQTAPTLLTPEQGYQQSAQQLSQSPFDPVTGDIRADVSDADAQRYFDGLYQRDPLKAIELNNHLQDIKTRRALTERARIENEAWERQKQIDDDRRISREAANKKAEAIEADAMRIMNEHIDPSGGVTGGRAVAGILAAFMGGLVQGKTGSPVNAGLQALNTAIDRGIDAQKADLANRRGGIDARRSLLADEMARHGDEFRAQEAMRTAAQAHAITMLDIEMQNYSPRGTSFAKAAAMKAGLVAQMAKGQQERNDKLFESGLKEREQARKDFETRQNALHQRATTALGYAQIKAQRDERDFQRDLKRQDKADERADKDAERLRKFSLGSPRPTLALDKDGRPIAGPDGKPLTTGSQFMNVDKDGKQTPWTVEDPDDRRAMKSKIVAASEISDMIDEVLDIRDKVGGESSLWNSEAKQRLDVLQARIALVRKGGTQGMSSDKDFENLAKSIGADNLNSFRSQAAKLKEARERTLAELNSEMRAANYTGPAVSFANKYAGSTNTPEDDKRQALLADPNLSLDDAIKANVDKVVADRGYGIDVSDPADQQLYQQIARDTAKRFQPGASETQAGDLAGYGKSAAAGDASALDVLKEVAQHGHTSKLRKLAQEQIDALTPKAAPRGPQSDAVAVPDELRLP